MRDAHVSVVEVRREYRRGAVQRLSRRPGRSRTWSLEGEQSGAESLALPNALSTRPSALSALPSASRRRSPIALPIFFLTASSGGLA